MKTIRDIDINVKTILLRVDLNVPVENGEVKDSSRLEAIVPTVKALQEVPRRIILCSHFGRPKGEIKEVYSLKQIIPALEQILEQKVIFIKNLSDLSDDNALYLLENTRFNKGEEANDNLYAQILAEPAQAYVNDAFSVAHRAHASTLGITKYLPSYAGLGLVQELKILDYVLKTPERPLTAIIGGAKISTKIDLLYNLVEKVDNLIIGGGMANSFLAAIGVNVGSSLLEKDVVPKAKDILEKAKQNSCSITLPVDVVVTKEFSANAVSCTRSIADIKDDEMILDIGPQTIEHIKDIVAKSKTVLWNGPMGAFEFKLFSKGTISIAKFIALQTKQNKLVSLAGGGDTIYALNLAGVKESLTYVSTAGGAFLTWLEGKAMPAIEALRR